MPAPERSFVVTGGGGGVGAAIVSRLRADGRVEVLDLAFGDDAASFEVASRAAAAAESVKAAVEGLTRAIAVDYGPSGIRCNAVALGSIRTARMTKEVEAGAAPLHPLGRVGEPQEVASVAASLLAPGFVSGAVIPIDGGRSVLGHDPEARLP